MVERAPSFQRALRLEIIEANYGRGFGWSVEIDGRRRVVLTEPRFEDMFWMSYAVEPAGETETERDEIFTRAFWDRGDLTYRNRRTGDLVTGAYPGARPPTRANPRVWMRGLALLIPEPTLYERVLLWWRKRSSR